MLELTILNWLVLDGAPLRQEESVLKINISATDKVISEEEIVIHSMYLQEWAAWEGRLEIVVLAEGRVWLIKLVVLSFIEFLVAKFEDQVRVREAAHVSRGQVES